MNHCEHRRSTVAATVAALAFATACAVDVRDQGSGAKKEVDIRTPVGDLSVRANNADTPETGLRVYPGAQPLRDRHEPENANVRVGSSLFELDLVVAKFESADDPQRIVDFYRTEMQAHGWVTECRGNVDFRGRRGAREPVCKERSSSGETQLVTGTEERHRIVSVKPRGAGTEFAIIYIKARES